MRFFAPSSYYNANAPYIFNWEHILLIVVSVALITLLGIFIRKSSDKTVKNWLISLWVIEVFFEFLKIGIKISYDGFGVLMTNTPVHLSSWFMYVMPFAIWGKGRIKHYAYAVLSTIMLFGGLVNFIIPSTLYDYPALTSFFGLHTMLYHVIMVATAVIIWVKLYKPAKYDFLAVMVALCIISIPALIFDLITGADYMFFSTGESTPLTILSNVILPRKWLWIIIMFLLYFLLIIVIYAIIWSVHYVINKIKSRSIKKA